MGGEQYGRFLVDIYEEWIRGDVGKVFVQLFDHCSVPNIALRRSWPGRND